jgi:hypothetical protein
VVSCWEFETKTSSSDTSGVGRVAVADVKELTARDVIVSGQGGRTRDRPNYKARLRFASFFTGINTTLHLTFFSSHRPVPASHSPNFRLHLV